jgi:hypothetical protein
MTTGLFDAPYEWRCDMSHVTPNATSTAKIVMNMTQRVHILPTITVTPFFIREYVRMDLRATGKHGTFAAANYGRPLCAHDAVALADLGLAG